MTCGPSSDPMRGEARSTSTSLPRAFDVAVAPGIAGVELSDEAHEGIDALRVRGGEAQAFHAPSSAEPTPGASGRDLCAQVPWST